MTVTTYHNMNYYTSMLVKFPATGNIKWLFQNLSMCHLFSFQTQYVWWMGVLMDGESCSTGQVGSGQQSALKAGTLRTPLSSAHTLAIPRESEKQMYCCDLAFSLICSTWPPTVTGWTILVWGLSLSHSVSVFHPSIFYIARPWDPWKETIGTCQPSCLV